MLQKVINRKYLVAGWMHKNQIFYYAWNGFVPPQDMKRLFEEILVHLQKGRPGLMLQDLRRAQAVGAEVQEWLINYWIPRVAEIGVRKIAILMPVSVFGQIAVNQVRGKSAVSNNGLESEIFDDEEQALRWLTASCATESK